MAQPTLDSHARRLKDLTSEVKRLRGWVASDPTKADPLVDALNELTASRLLARQHADAFADAQDALVQANRLVAFHGAVGPFTPVDDGVRFFTATAHVAALQAAAGQAASAGQTAAALRGWTGLLPHVDLTPHVAPRTAVLLLRAEALSALATGDVGRANAYADAAWARAREAALDADADLAGLFADVAALVGDCRWVAGLGHDALHASRQAVEAARVVAAPVLDGGNRVAEAWSERVLAPLAAAHRNLADRLLDLGDSEAGLAERRALADVLRRHVGRLGDPAREALAHTLVDLAHDLEALGRHDEALQAAGEAATLAGQLAASEPRPGARLGVQFAAVVELARILLVRDEADEAQEAIASLFERFASVRRPAGHEAALTRAVLVRAEIERAHGDPEAAERSLREFHTLVAALLADTPGGMALFGDVPRDAYARARARGVVCRSPLPTPAWIPLSDAESLAASTAPKVPEGEIDVTPAPVVPPAPVAEPARVFEPVPAPTPQPEPIPAPEPEPAPAVAQLPEPEPEPAPAPVQLTESEPEHEPEPTPEPEPRPAPVDASAQVEAALAAYRAAHASGDRRETLHAASAVVDGLRPLAASDPGRWGALLVDALNDLGDAMFRTGDWWGSRAPKKEAKALARQLAG